MDKFLSLTDEELVACIRGGDPGAEEALILRYTSYVRSFTRPYFLVGGDSEDLIQEGLTAKLLGLPDEVRGKFRGTLTRIVNEGATGLICLIL